MRGRNCNLLRSAVQLVSSVQLLCRNACTLPLHRVLYCTRLTALLTKNYGTNCISNACNGCITIRYELRYNKSTDLYTSVALVVRAETDPNDMVMCRNDQFCGTSATKTTRHECCRSATGISYTVEGTQGCFICPGNYYSYTYS